MSRRSSLLAVVALAAPLSGPPATAAEKPSFACTGKLNARETVICRDPRLAASDRALAAAYADARRFLPKEAADALRKDQTDYLQMLDGGFDAQIWFKANVPDDRRKVEADLRRVLAEDRETLDGLRAEIDARTATLRSLRTDVQGFVGTWKNGRATLTVEPRRQGAHAVRFAEPSYGWPKYECYFDGKGTVEGDRLVVEFVEESGPDALPRGRLIVTRAGPFLDALETVDETRTDDDRQYWICAHSPEVKGRFFAVTVPGETR